MIKYFKKDSLLSRFISVGILNTFFGYGVGILFITVLPFHYSISILLATFFGIIFNYFTSSKLVFNVSLSNNKLIIFVINYIFLYLLTLLLMQSIFYFNINLDTRLAYLIVAPFIIVLTFVTQRFIVFKES